MIEEWLSGYCANNNSRYKATQSALLSKVQAHTANGISRFIKKQINLHD